MNIEELTIGQVKELQKILGIKGATGITEGHPYQIGQPYFIRLVTHYYVGRLMAVFMQDLVLEDAAWIPDTGRFHSALASGVFDEVEPFPDGPVLISRGAIVDATVMPALKLPLEAK